MPGRIEVGRQLDYSVNWKRTRRENRRFMRAAVLGDRIPRMSTGSRKQKRGKRLPAIVPRFLKGAVTIGAIPALVGACSTPKRPQPVVAAYGGALQPVVAYYAADAGVQPRPPLPPVVAMYTPPVVPVVPADAAV